MQPVLDALAALAPTNAERTELADLLQRAEAIAAARFEAARHNQQQLVRVYDRQLALLVRVLKGRVQASRAETAANAAEGEASRAEAQRRLLRARVERLGEALVEAETRTRGGNPMRVDPANPAGSPGQ